MENKHKNPNVPPFKAGERYYRRFLPDCKQVVCEVVRLEWIPIEDFWRVWFFVPGPEEKSIRWGHSHLFREIGEEVKVRKQNFIKSIY